MKQFTSSEDVANRGETLLNCNFNMGLDIILPIVNATSQLMDGRTEKFLRQHLNSAVAFSLLNEYLHRGYNRNIPMNTKHGRVFKVASGVSKTAICLQNEYNTRIVVKYNHEPIQTTNGKFCLPRETAEQRKNFNQQVESQVATWDRLLSDKKIAEHLLPTFRAYNRYNAVIESYADHVGNAKDYVTAKEYNDFRLLMIEYNIGDMHSNNIGIYKGKLVAIDYAL